LQVKAVAVSGFGGGQILSVELGAPSPGTGSAHRPKLPGRFRGLTLARILIEWAAWMPFSRGNSPPAKYSPPDRVSPESQFQAATNSTTKFFPRRARRVSKHPTAGINELIFFVSVGVYPWFNFPK
jgi:hypothetical protein